MRHIQEEILVPAHRRTRPTLAPLESCWVAEQRRIQQMEMARMAAQQGGVPAQMPPPPALDSSGPCGHL